MNCACRVNRRGFLAAAVAAPLAAQPAPHRIDIHHHLTPPAYVQRLAPRMPLSPLQTGWSVARTLADMDAAGIRTAMLSVTSPGFWFGDAGEARDLVRASNEYGQGLVRDHAGRFGHFAALPLPDVDGALEATRHALDVLGADGIALFTSYGGKYLGDASFAPLFEELNRRRAIVYTHPNTAACCANVQPGVPEPAIEFGTDTTRTIASWVFGGFAQRFPDIRIIFSHAGGTLPALVERFDFLAAQTPQNRARFPEGIRPLLRGLYYDTAQASDPAPMAALRHIVPISQVLFGTDYPYRRGAENVAGLAALGWPAADLAAVERGNAQRLLPRLN